MIARFLRGDDFGQACVRSDGLVIDAGDDIAFFKTSLVGCAVRRHFHYKYPGYITIDAQFLFLSVVETFGCHADTQVASLHRAIFHDVANDLLH